MSFSDKRPTIDEIVYFIARSKNEDVENLDLSTLLQESEAAYQKYLLFRVNQFSENQLRGPSLSLDRIVKVKKELKITGSHKTSKQPVNKIVRIGFSLGAVAALALVVIFSYPLFKSTEQAVTERHAYLTFARGKVLVNDQPAQTGQKLKQADIIKTRKKSMAVVQIDTGALLTLRSRSTIALEKVLLNQKNKSVIISQSRGISINKIQTGALDYRLKVPTAVAGVRGTVFSMEFRKGRGAIKLLKGKVEAFPIKDGKIINKKKVILGKGRKVKISKSARISKPRKLTKKERKFLKIFDKNVKFAAISGEDKKISITLEKNIEKILTSARKEKKVVEELSLSALKKKYKKLYTVTTRKGDTLVGAVVDRGKRVLVITPKRRLELDKKMVVSKKPLPEIFNN